MRWVIIILLLIIGYLQYRLWWGDGGRLELRRLEQRVVDSERANEQLRQRNDELARQIMDLKEGSTVLEQRAREELGLTGENEVFYHIVESQDSNNALGDGAAAGSQAEKPES
ncbi:MAG: cell division protein FtsB [Pseudomonadota bacterium]